MEIPDRAIRPILSILCFPCLILLPWPVMACSCTGALSPCYEVATGSAVFTGRVISVSPAFLNRLNRSSRTDAGRVGQFYDQLVSGVLEQTLQGMKETFLGLIPGLSPDSFRRIQEAKSRQELLKVFDSVLDHGSYVTLEVKTVFTKGGDDDDDKKNKGKDDDRGKDAKNAKVKDDDDDDDAALAGGLLRRRQ